MSPDDIAEVSNRWSRAVGEPQLLEQAIADQLDSELRSRDQRARWIIDTVTCLSAVLEHPGAFASRAVDLLAQRPHVTIDELTSDCHALLAALEVRCGPLDDRALRSWNLAIGLFAEFVGEAGVNPFDDGGGDTENRS